MKNAKLESSHKACSFRNAAFTTEFFLRTFDTWIIMLIFHTVIFTNYNWVGQAAVNEMTVYGLPMRQHTLVITYVHDEHKCMMKHQTAISAYFTNIRRNCSGTRLSIWLKTIDGILKYMSSTYISFNFATRTSRDINRCKTLKSVTLLWISPIEFFNGSYNSTLKVF